jgi:predicted transcriptional regulator
VGNVTRRLTDADHTYQNLYYKAKKSLSFEKFLNKAQDMWNIYEENNQSYNEVTKIRWLFQQVKSSDENIISTIAACRHQFWKDDSCITYAEVAEQIAAAVIEATSTKLTRSVSAISRNTQSLKPQGENKLDLIFIREACKDP